MSNLDYALTYAARGWRVFPVFTIEDGKCSCKNPNCASPGKHPHIQDWDENATTDGEQIKAWWTQKPDANIAIATGKASGIWSLDVDGKEGHDSMIQVLSDGRTVPLTFWFKTGGGGRQVFFSWPQEGKEVRNRVGIFTSVDVRGENGYVLAPPSRHISGRQYTLPVPINLPVAIAPDWLIETVSSRKEIVLIPGNGGLKVSNGNRNAELYRMGAHMKDEFPGLHNEVLFAFLSAVNKFHCEEPLLEPELVSIVRNISRYSR